MFDQCLRTSLGGEPWRHRPLSIALVEPRLALDRLIKPPSSDQFLTTYIQLSGHGSRDSRNLLPCSNQYSRFVEIFCICFICFGSPRSRRNENPNCRGVQRRDELYGKLKISIEDLNEVERLERELLKVEFQIMQFPRETPGRTFDLIVLSEVGYYLSE